MSCLSFQSCSITAAVGRCVSRSTTCLEITANRGLSPDCQAQESVGMTLAVRCGLGDCGSANSHIYKLHCAGEQLAVLMFL